MLHKISKKFKRCVPVTSELIRGKEGNLIELYVKSTTWISRSLAEF